VNPPRTRPVPAGRRTGAAVTTGVDLYWLPLGAGGPVGVVRRCGRAYEALVARRDHRRPADLYHAALEVCVDGDRVVIESAPAWGAASAGPPAARGVVGGGPVGLRLLGRSRFFRYELRCWRGGVIPDVAEAVGGAHRLSADRPTARRVLELVPGVPRFTWGRDELGTGDMWNSNSVVAWLLARSGHDLVGVVPPAGGRAPGWIAGAVVAGRP
jgi:hypothetical protein